MREGWQFKKVSEIAQHSLGKMLDKAKNRGEPKPYLRNLNVRWLEFDLSDLLEMRFLPEEEDRYSAIKGDVLICEGGYPGRAAIWDGDDPVYFQKALHRVRFHELERNRWFLYYLLFKDLDGTLKSHFNGSGIQHFTGEALAKFEVPLPPLSEQQRIVAILDEAFEAIATAKANAEKNLQNARALFESQLQSVFTRRGKDWVEKPLVELCESARVITYGVIKLGDEVPKGVPCLRTSNVRWLRIETEGMKRIEPALSAEYSRTILRGGEVLVNVRGTLGGVAVVEPSMRGWNVSREVAVVPIDQTRISPTFLSYLIGSGTSQQWLGGVKKGAAYVGINIEDLRLLPVSAPKLAEQKRIVRHLDDLRTETERLAAIYTRKLAALDELKKSLLHQAFTGQLTANFRETVSIPFPAELPGISITDLHAGILAMAYRTHERGNKLDHLTKVKVEKISHMIEAWTGIELGRKPVKDYFGPNDTKHLKGVEHRAKMTKSFSFQKDSDGGERIRKLDNFDALLTKTEVALGERQQAVEELLTLMLPMSHQQAEIFTTVHAAWNNLLLTGQEATDEAIVTEARENWHPEKLKIERDKFFRAITWIRGKNLVPQGRGKLVEAKSK